MFLQGCVFDILLFQLYLSQIFQLGWAYEDKNEVSENIKLKTFFKIVCVTFFFIFGNFIFANADHSLREIERRCEVYWDGEYGELDCRSSVSDRRDLERKCEVEWDGYEGEFDCRGSHFRDVERRCEADRDGDIDC